VLSKAHFGHRLESGVPRWLQKREPAELSVPQFEQRLAFTENRVDTRFCITHQGTQAP
jgi:hypothetical protein